MYIPSSVVLTDDKFGCCRCVASRKKDKNSSSTRTKVCESIVWTIQCKQVGKYQDQSSNQVSKAIEMQWGHGLVFSCNGAFKCLRYEVYV